MLPTSNGPTGSVVLELSGEPHVRRATDRLRGGQDASSGAGGDAAGGPRLDAGRDVPIRRRRQIPQQAENGGDDRRARVPAHDLRCRGRRYDRARPEYPDDLLDELVRRTNLTRGSLVLEVGCGTGKATRPLAARGFRVTCVELGPELAARARTKLTGVGDVEVVQGAFESCEPPDGAAYDALVAATSWHWIDPNVRYRKALHLLRPGGHLAFWSAMHVFPDSGDSAFRELQDVYEEIGEGSSLPRPTSRRSRSAKEASGFWSARPSSMSIQPMGRS